MTKNNLSAAPLKFSSDHLQRLIDTLIARGYTVVGPTPRNNAIALEPIASVDDLPVGYTDTQEAASYRLQKNGSSAAFGWVNSPNAWKRYLYPPVQTLWQVKKENKSFSEVAQDDQVPRYAFIGVRSCDLEALKKYDRIFWHSEYPDMTYAMRREGLFVVAVNCTRAGETCFCASMGGGPKAESGFDLAMTELAENGTCAYVVEVGSEAGADIAGAIRAAKAQEPDIAAAKKLIDAAVNGMGRTLDTDGLKEALYRNYESSRWDDIADRCLTCGNCTMVCPTCFCTTIQDTTNLAGTTASRVRKWDSCYTIGFSYIHGGSVRTSPYARYRHWLMHKLASWHDQFDTSGCVGCGRCITWCPVGIDITEEANAIRLRKTKK